MSERVASYRRILKTSSIIGGASTINIFLGILRTKVLAVLVGSAGLGLVSLYMSLMNTATVIASMGMGTVGARQVAEANALEDSQALGTTRRAMFLASIVLAIIGGAMVWALRGVLAEQVLDNKRYTEVVGWLALGVSFSVAAASQSAVIQGMRKIGDLARISIFSSAINTVIGVILLWQWGISGLWAYVLIGPLSSMFFGYIYVSRLPKIEPHSIAHREIAEQWKQMIRLGLPFVGAGLAQTLVALWIRMTVNDTLGVSAVGHFQAAWAISMQYIGFVLAAMGADYYPRLAGIINNHEEANRVVNEQTEIALLLGAPVFIVMMGLAPWVIDALYSAAFLPAVEVLRWQILGDILKVASWPLGFIILAAGAGKTFFWTETLSLVLMGSVVAVFVTSLGLKITGIAFLISYVLYLPLVYFLAWKRIRFIWSRSVILLLIITFILTVLMAILPDFTAWSKYISIIISSVVLVFSFGRISQKIEMSGWLWRMGVIARKITLQKELRNG